MNKSKYNHSPNVSVVMPVFNGARTLMEAVNSILNQTYHDLELIICNDASTDETPKLLSSLTDSRIRVIHNSHNLGEGPTRDRAIEMANGFWLGFIDADDSWASERLDILLHEAGNSEDKILFDDIWQCHDTPSGMIPWRVLRGKYAFGADGTNSVEVPIDKFICEKSLIKSALFPLKYIKQYNITHSCLPFASDTEFFLKLLSHELKLYYVPKPMYYYRITPGSMTALSKRSTLMRRVLESTVKEFTHNPQAQIALQKKIAMVSRYEEYMPFILSLKKKEILKALILSCQSPWIIPEFFRRATKSGFYHIHRIWHRGLPRGIR